MSDPLVPPNLLPSQPATKDETRQAGLKVVSDIVADLDAPTEDELADVATVLEALGLKGYMGRAKSPNRTGRGKAAWRDPA